MKKYMMLVLTLVSSIPLQASEQKPWWHNATTLAGIAAATTSALAGVALWQWNKISARKDTYDKAIADKPNLAGEQAELQKVLESNDRMLEGHMKRSSYQIAHEVSELEKKNFKKITIKPHLQQWSAARDGHQDFQGYCTPCAIAYGNSSASSYAQRQKACDLASTAHSSLKRTVTTRKTAVDQALTDAQTAIDRDSNTDFKRLLSRAKTIGYSSAAVSLASLAYLGLKTATGK